jgi:hypothetical protein
MTAIELDWEFNAPHWFDFSQEDVGNPDAWFDEQAAKLADDSHMPLSVHDTEHVGPPTAGSKRKGTRIPVLVPGYLRKTQEVRAFAPSHMPRNLVSKLATDPPSGSSRFRNTSGKLSTRIPLSERRNHFQ